MDYLESLEAQYRSDLIYALINLGTRLSRLSNQLAEDTSRGVNSLGEVGVQGAGIDRLCVQLEILRDIRRRGYGKDGVGG